MGWCSHSDLQAPHLYSRDPHTPHTWLLKFLFYCPGEQGRHQTLPVSLPSARSAVFAAGLSQVGTPRLQRSCQWLLREASRFSVVLLRYVWTTCLLNWFNSEPNPSTWSLLSASFFLRVNCLLLALSPPPAAILQSQAPFSGLSVTETWLHPKAKKKKKRKRHNKF